MKTVLRVLVLGLVAGLASHAGWYLLRRPAPVSDPAAALAWMQQDLQLSPAQYARIKAIHEQSGPRLRELTAQAQRMRLELEGFERVRRTDGQVDFLQFARFIEGRRAFDRLCNESTTGLIAATAGELTPAQRDRYLAAIQPAGHLN
jgi:hypothetical protein